MGSELEVRERTALDSKLISYARKSPNEIAELTGLTPEVAAQRISELLASRDWLSEKQEERLLLEEIIDLKNEIVSRVRGAEDKDFASMASIALRSMGLIADRLDARRRLVDSDISSITQAQAKVFGQAFDIALSHVVGVLGDGVDAEIVDATVRDGLSMAAKSLDEKISSD